MSWRAYSVSWPLLSPVHIGFRKTGNLQVTRPYVPSWVLWGAFTARLTRSLANGNYADVGDQVKKEMAFTHFLFDSGPGSLVYPWGDFRYEFDWRYLRSHTGTALADGYTKEDGSLHETEYIGPLDRQGRRVQLRGTVFVREPSRLDWRSAAGALTLGGERAYGWGRVGVPEVAETRNSDWVLAGERPAKVYSQSDVCIPGHVLRRGKSDTEVRLHGNTEVVVRRITDTATGQFGRKVLAPRFCWAPGAKANQSLRLEIDPEGYLLDIGVH